MVKGKRIKTIDVHAHCFFREAVDLMGDDAAQVMPPVKGVQEHFIVVEQRLKGMDEHGDRHGGALHQSVLVPQGSRHSPRRSCKVQNEKLAELCAAQPDRFAAFASLAMQFPDLAVQQLETAVKKQGLRGAAIGGSVLGRGFRRSEVSSGAGRRPKSSAPCCSSTRRARRELAQRFKGNGWLSNTIGNPLDTTIALQHLIFEGTLDKFPGLKILAAHGGGYLGSYAPRSDHACFVSPQNCNPDIGSRRSRPST